ncbi:Centrosomal protein of 44 kDa [Sorochytrium milnesiophthora]
MSFLLARTLPTATQLSSRQTTALAPAVLIAAKRVTTILACRGVSKFRHPSISLDVVLREDVDKVGRAGDVVRLRPGHARNWIAGTGKGMIIPRDKNAVRRHAKIYQQLGYPLDTIYAVHDGTLVPKKKEDYEYKCYLSFGEYLDNRMLTHAEAQLRNDLLSLQSLLRKMHFPRQLNVEGLQTGSSAAILPLIHYALYEYSPLVRRLVNERGLELSGKNDARFMDGVYLLLRDLWAYKPVLRKEQFFQVGYAHRKLQLLGDILRMASKEHASLRRLSGSSVGHGQARTPPRPPVPAQASPPPPPATNIAEQPTFAYEPSVLEPEAESPVPQPCEQRLAGASVLYPTMIEDTAEEVDNGDPFVAHLTHLKQSAAAWQDALPSSPRSRSSSSSSTTLSATSSTYRHARPQADDVASPAALLKATQILDKLRVSIEFFEKRLVDLESACQVAGERLARKQATASDVRPEKLPPPVPPPATSSPAAEVAAPHVDDVKMQQAARLKSTILERLRQTRQICDG